MNTYQSQVSSEIGFNGTNYITVLAVGTDLQNAHELTIAYNKAKLLTPGEENSFTILCCPGLYNFVEDFVLDQDFINVISLSNKIDVIFNGSFNLDLTANNVNISGIDLRSNAFIIAQNLDKIVIENCIVGDHSFTMIGGNISGTFKNIATGDHCFRIWGSYGEFSGIFTNLNLGLNCIVTDLNSLINGTFNQIQCGIACFKFGNLTGIFKDIVSPDIFKDLSTLTGVVYDARQTDKTESLGLIHWRGKVFNSISGTGSIDLFYEVTPDMPTLILTVKTTPRVNSSSGVNYFRLTADFTGIDSSQTDSIVWSQVTSHTISNIMEGTPSLNDMDVTFYDIENNQIYDISCIITDIYGRSFEQIIQMNVAI